MREVAQIGYTIAESVSRRISSIGIAKRVSDLSRFLGQRFRRFVEGNLRQQVGLLVDDREDRESANDACQRCHRPAAAPSNLLSGRGHPLPRLRLSQRL